MTILAVALAVSFKSLGGATALNAAGAKVSDILTEARQNSTSKGVLTAVVLLTNPGSPQTAYRTFTLLQLTPPDTGVTAQSANWAEVSTWQSLNNGIVVDNSMGTFFQSPSIVPALPTLTYLNSPVLPSQCAYQIFMPNGQPYQDASGNPALPCTLRLVSGFYAASKLTYINPLAGSSGASPGDYIELIITEATGSVKIVHP
jgi:hypothetical protein